MWRSQWEIRHEANYAGLGRLYRQISQDSLRFQFKPFVDIKDFWPIYIQLKTGIGPFANYLNMIGKSVTPFCRCGKSETSVHIIRFCSLYKEQRKDLFKSTKTLDLCVLFCTKSGIESLLRFIDGCGIKHKGLRL